MALAWACVRGTYVPGYVSLEIASIALGGNDAYKRLAYLKERLHLLQIAQPAQDRVRFVLDPLTEYLAGLWLVIHYRTDDTKWRALLHEVDSAAGGPERIKGFLLALRDCCRARRADVPQFLVQDLDRRAGLSLTPRVNSVQNAVVAD